jgi:hypothetical protein
MMTLRNIRENGVRTLAITSGAVWCNHYAVLDVNAFADDLAGLRCHWRGCAAKLERPCASLSVWTTRLI